MPKTHRPTSDSFTDAQKRELVERIERRNRLEGVGIAVLSHEAGLPGGAYYRWRSQLGPAGKPAKVAAVAPVPPANRPYSADERAALLAEIGRRRERGEEIDDACRAVGVTRTTYRRWRLPPAPALDFRPVTVAADASSLALALLVPRATSPAALPAATLALSVPGGYRLEGLTVETAVQLLRGLAHAEATC